MLGARAVALATTAVLALAAAGCGGGGNSSSSGSGSSGQATQTQTQTQSQSTQSQSTGSGGTATASAGGKAVFTQNCKGCHTLAAANASGQVGPNLDELQPDKATVQRQVINGGGPMPSFKDKLSQQQIQAVSQYVSSVAGK
jgi:mono/diheme cytochrome c family protein